MKELLENILSKYQASRKDGLISVLQDIQNEQGYLTEESIEAVAKYLNLPVNKIYGVAAFYNQFRFRPKGQYHIQVCHGTTCHLFGTDTLIKELEKQLKVKAGGTSRDRKFSLEIGNCLGACEHAPVMRINDTYYTRVTPDSFRKIIRTLKEKTD